MSYVCNNFMHYLIKNEGVDSEGEDDFLEDADNLEESKDAERRNSEEKEGGPELVAGKVGNREEENQDKEETRETIEAAGKNAQID